MPDTGWKLHFEDPIILPNGSKLVTLLDAGNYIASLPRKETQTDHWQVAIEALLMAAQDRGPLLHARVGMRRARFQPVTQGSSLGTSQASAGSMTCALVVWITVCLGPQSKLLAVSAYGPNEISHRRFSQPRQWLFPTW